MHQLLTSGSFEAHEHRMCFYSRKEIFLANNFPVLKIMSAFVSFVMVHGITLGAPVKAQFATITTVQQEIFAELKICCCWAPTNLG
jgi:hypothetical protein